MSNPLSANPAKVNMSASTLPSQYLKFKLYPEVEAMLPVDQITEILKLRLVQIMPIPQMPTWVMGVYNWRGEILWMVDLSQLLGLDSWYRHQSESSKHTAVVLSAERQQVRIHLGLIVAQVDDLAYCDPNTIQSAIDNQLDASWSNFARGYWLDPSGSMVLALEGGAIAEAMPTNP